jgi:uncharacterized protein
MKRFMADAMLGSLARWLRILGFDAAYAGKMEDSEIVRMARLSGRAVLTKDRRLVQRRALRDFRLIEAQSLDDQLLEVLDHFHLDVRPRLLFSRCLRCNVPLKDVPLDSVSGRVPDYVLQTRTRFSVCPRCRGIFWPGTHRDRMQRRIQRILVRRISFHAPSGDPAADLPARKMSV